MNKKKLYVICLAASLVSFLLLPHLTFAEVSGHLTVKKIHSEIVINVDNPAPQSIIVEQRASGAVRQTTPQAQKIGNGSVTWLIREPQPGNLHLRTQFQQPVAQQISAVVKYKDRNSGKFVQRVIMP